MKRDLFLEEARLGPRSPALIEYDEAPRLVQSRERFRAYAVVDLAHAVMMIEQGMLTRDRGAKLLAGLLQILDLGPDGFPWEPQSRCSPDIAEEPNNPCSAQPAPDSASRLSVSAQAAHWPACEEPGPAPRGTAPAATGSG